jgi:hypothetical protein
MAAPAEDFLGGKRPRPPQYLGQGTTTRALGEAPTQASEPEFWTLQVDSLRADGASTRRCDARDGTYSDNAWYEIDIPVGWIPAEIGNLAVTVADLSVTPFRASGITFTGDVPWSFNTNTPSNASAVANNPAANPTFKPFYARSGSMATATSVSFMDSGCYLAMQVRGVSRGLPHYLSSLKDDFVSLGGWPLTNGNDTAPPLYSDPSMTSPVVQISNPSGGTIRFEQRLMASNAMPSLNGSTGTTTLVSLGWPAWRVVLRLTPVLTAQYGGVAVATERQFV